MIAVDWGTSSFRAYRVRDDGTIQEQRNSGEGLLSVQGGRFADVLTRQIGDWRAIDAGPVIMCGMVGSRQGWIEVPYVSCPAGGDEIAGGLRYVSWGEGDRAWVVPGVSH